MPGAMSAETNPNRAVETVLPEDLELTPQPQPVEVPPPEVLPAEAARRPRRAFAFLRVFRHRNYRLFFTGQLVSLMGTWITNVTQGYLVYSLTHSPLLLGVVTFRRPGAGVFLFGLRRHDLRPLRPPPHAAAHPVAGLRGIGGAGGPDPDRI